MGTKLQSVLNPLAALPRNNGDEVNISFEAGNSQHYFRKRNLKESTKTGFDDLQQSMDRLHEQYNRESMRKIMLKQEEIFKKQVQELHRLYRVQKLLMAELRIKEMKPPSPADAAPKAIQSEAHYAVGYSAPACLSAASSMAHRSPSTNSNHLATQTNSEYNVDRLYKLRINPVSQELSTCSKDATKLQWGFDLEWPTREDMSTDVSTVEDQAPVAQTPSESKTTIIGPQDTNFYLDEDPDIDLTLSIGYSSSKKKSKHRPCSNLELGCSELTPGKPVQSLPTISVRSDQEEECSNTARTNFDRGGLQRPRWLFQALSLNRT